MFTFNVILTRMRAPSPAPNTRVYFSFYEIMGRKRKNRVNIYVTEDFANSIRERRGGHFYLESWVF